jgi:hypothetical protein
LELVLREIERDECWMVACQMFDMQQLVVSQAQLSEVWQGAEVGHAGQTIVAQVDGAQGGKISGQQRRDGGELKL